MTVDELIKKLQALKTSLEPTRANVVTITYDDVCTVNADPNIKVGTAWRCKGCGTTRMVLWCACEYAEARDYEDPSIFEEVTTVSIETVQ